MQKVLDYFFTYLRDEFSVLINFQRKLFQQLTSDCCRKPRDSSDEESTRAVSSFCFSHSHSDSMLSQLRCDISLNVYKTIHINTSIVIAGFSLCLLFLFSPPAYMEQLESRKHWGWGSDHQCIVYFNHRNIPTTIFELSRSKKMSKLKSY